MDHVCRAWVTVPSRTLLSTFFLCLCFLAVPAVNLGAILLHALFEHWIEINSQRDTGLSR